MSGGVYRRTVKNAIRRILGLSEKPYPPRIIAHPQLYCAGCHAETTFCIIQQGERTVKTCCGCGVGWEV